MTKDHLAAATLDGALLGLFMLAAGTFGALLEAPGAALQAAVGEPFARRALMGLAMGATAVLLIRSPLGQRCGAHMNPATTFTFWWLGRVPGTVAVLYAVAQFVGGTLGILLAGLLVPAVGAPPVDFVVTRPGAFGIAAAFAAEAAMTFVLLSLVLRVSQSRRWNRHTALCAGGLVAAYITFEAPISGMSMNPARTFASAFAAGDFTAFWLYATAPLAGMLLAAAWFVRGAHRVVHCAKLHHDNSHRCPFRCGWDAA